MDLLTKSISVFFHSRQKAIEKYYNHAHELQDLQYICVI